jgi:ELWxxDGT repeat protein
MTRPRVHRPRRRLRFEALEARLTPSNSPVLIKDIATGTPDSNPAGFAGMGGKIYFSAVGPTGNELWQSDGTAANTVNVADINPGGTTIPNSSNPSNLMALGNTLFFAANDGATGAELWKTDGSAAGTALVKDIRTGANSSSPSLLTVVGTTLYFTAADATTGNELWKSDGTANGTVEVADLTPGSADTTFG